MLPHAAGELSVIRWHTVTQGEAQLEMPTGDAMTLRRERWQILPQNSAHRLRQFGEALTHIVCGSSAARTRRHVISLPRCRKCYVFAPPPHSPASIRLNAAILLLQQESERHCPR